MTMKDAVRICFKKYIDFSGRAARPELWLFVLACILVSAALTVVNTAIFGPTVNEGIQVSIDQNGQQTQSTIISKSYTGGWLGVIFSVIVLLPTLTTCWRRLQDLGRPGWHILIPVPFFVMTFLAMTVNQIEVPVDTSMLADPTGVPTTISVPGNVIAVIAAGALSILAVIYILINLARGSQPGPNEYGPNPYEAQS